MAGEANPRQFSSLDNSGLSISLTNRPASGIPATQPIDYAIHFDIERQLIDYQKQNGTYQPRTSAGEAASEQQFKAARDAAFRESVKQEKAAQEIQAQAEQAQRTELLNRIKGEQGTPNPYTDESDRNRIRRVNNQPPIDEPPASTPNRQPTPSTGRPPPTANGTAARASPMVEPTATPPPVMLAEPIPPPSSGGFSDALPRSLPQSAGRLAVPGAFAAVDFGIRVYQGQPVGQAASGSVAGAVGAFGGAALGAAIAGPVGAVIGGMVGGYVAGAISDSFFHSPPSTGSPPSEIPNYPPFRGGQASATYSWNFWSGRMLRQYGGFVYSFACIGPASDFKRLGILNTDESVSPPAVNYACQFTDGNGQIVGGSVVCDKDGDLPFLILHRVDAKPDPDIIAPAPPPDNKPYYFAGTFLNGDATIPSGKPAAGTNKGKNPDPGPGIPGNNTHNGNGYFPGHGGLAPSSTPNPTQYASNLGGMLPGAGAAPAPPPFAEQKDTPGLRFAPAPGGSPSPNPGGSASSDPGGSPSSPPDPNVSRIDNGVVTSPRILTAQPIPLGSSPVTIPSGSPTTKKQNPTPDGTSPVPKVDTAPTPKTPETTTDKTNQIIQQQKQSFDEQIARLTTIGGLIAGLTPIVQGMPDIIAGLTPVIQGIPDAIAKSPTVQAANKKTTQGAVCEIAQPGGCLGDALDNSAEKVNQNNNQNANNLLDKINAGANAAQLALLELINAKLGIQLPGGIAGKLSRFADWMHLDRVLNIMIFGATMHNALMLSNDIGQTFVGIINNILQFVGLKKEDGSAFDIGSVISGSIENLIKNAVGADNYTELKAEWAKANRIYQATTNIFNSFQGIASSILNANEMLGSMTGKIGNALRKSGAVLEKSYEWFNPQPKYNRVTQGLEALQQGASTVQQVTQVPLDITAQVTELTTASTEFVKAVKEDDKPVNKGIGSPEPIKIKADEVAAKTASATGFDLLDIFFEEDE